MWREQEEKDRKCTVRQQNFKIKEEVVKENVGAEPSSHDDRLAATC